MGLFGSRSKRSMAEPVQAPIRQALMFGSYRVSIKGGGTSEFMLHRLVSDDYRYIGGVVLVPGGFCIYAESPHDKYVRRVDRRDEAERQWHHLRGALASQIGVDPDTEELPNLSHYTGWSWFRGLSPDTAMAAHFSHPTGVRGCLREIANDDVRLYIEYHERGLEKYFTRTDVARTAFNALQTGTQGFANDLGPMRPKRFLPTVLEQPPADPLVSLSGRVSIGGSAFAWGSIGHDDGQVGWALLHHYGGRVVLPFETPEGASAFVDAMAAGTRRDD